MATHLTEANFSQLVEKNIGPVVIDFWAEWCGPCRVVAPIIEELAKEYEGKATVLKCDVDDNAALATKYSIRNIPTVIFLKNGEIVDKIIGAVPKNKYVEALNKLL
ncbi:MAG: thioredoxin [Bacteroidales bacterium]